MSYLTFTKVNYRETGISNIWVKSRCALRNFFKPFCWKQISSPDPWKKTIYLNKLKFFLFFLLLSWAQSFFVFKSSAISKLNQHLKSSLGQLGPAQKQKRVRKKKIEVIFVHLSNNFEATNCNVYLRLQLLWWIATK